LRWNFFASSLKKEISKPIFLNIPILKIESELLAFNLFFAFSAPSAVPGFKHFLFAVQAVF
jgi:hypothetical protein